MNTIQDMVGNNDIRGNSPRKGRTMRNSMTRIVGSLLAIPTMLAGMAVAGSAYAVEDARGPAPAAKPVVRTADHVDSPHAFWQDNNFVLRSHSGEAPYPRIDDTVNWIGKGWYNGGRATYIYTVADDKAHAFLGKSGQRLYLAPAVPDTTSYSPIWMGMGADKAIPVDRFRDGQFTLDVMRVQGPGRMEFFNDDGDQVTRLLSSQDPSYRSYWMTAGSHTHNNTTFTKPGRYVVTYRVSARTNDGQLVKSASQHLVYQVGGANPSSNTLPGDMSDVAAAYNAAASVGNQRTVTVTLEPKRNKAKAGDEALTTMSLDTHHTNDEGVAVFTIDGYYLTQVPVHQGKASWDEMLGDLPSSIQAMYIPRSGSTARWISQPVQYRTGLARTAVSQGASELSPENGSDVSPVFPYREGHVSSADRLNVSLSAMDGDGRVAMHAHIGDKDFYAKIMGGAYEGDDDVPACAVEDTAISGYADVDKKLNWSWCQDSGETYTLRLRIVPHALIGGPSGEIVVKQYDPQKAYNDLHVQWNGAPVKDHDGDTSNPAPKPATGKRDIPVGQSFLCGKTYCIFNNGHLDIFAGGIAGDGKPTLDIKEDITGSEVHRNPEQVFLKVNKLAHRKKLSKQTFGVSEAYVLPQTQDQRVLWPGWDTNGIKSHGYRASAVHIESLTGPDGGMVFAFQEQGLGGGELPVASDGGLSLAKGKTIEIAQPSHAHLNWVFTKAGVYRMQARLEVKGRTAGEASLMSASHTYTWCVDVACPVPADDVASVGDGGVSPIAQPVPERDDVIVGADGSSDAVRDGRETSSDAADGESVAAAGANGNVDAKGQASQPGQVTQQGALALTGGLAVDPVGVVIAAAVVIMMLSLVSVVAVRRTMRP